MVGPTTPDQCGQNPGYVSYVCIEQNLNGLDLVLLCMELCMPRVSANNEIHEQVKFI